MSRRLVDLLRTSDIVAAEDTRRARKLLTHVDAHTRVMSYHAHSPPGRLDQLTSALEAGSSVVMLTDAGTPTVSDPGRELVSAARKLGTDIVAVPGPSAVTAALSVSGLPADRFTFLGFLPRKGTERRRRLEEASISRWTVVMFEAATRLKPLLEALVDVCGEDREAVVARELTKLHGRLGAAPCGSWWVITKNTPPVERSPCW
jgi:16S rRNA (cytidine1402-2'-O)-methyltransferase